MTYRKFYYQSLKEAEKTDREPSGIKWLFLAVTQKSFADFVLSWHEPIPDTEFKILNELIGKYLRIAADSVSARQTTFTV